MEDWQIRQKHREDIVATHRKLDHRDPRGNIRFFRGNTFFEEIQKLGHTSSELEKCECWQNRTSQRATGRL